MKYEEEVQKLDKNKGRGKLEQEIKEADEEVLKIRGKEGKEVKYSEWVVVTRLDWVGGGQGGYGEGLKLKAGEQMKKHFIKSLFS